LNDSRPAHYTSQVQGLTAPDGTWMPFFQDTNTMMDHPYFDPSSINIYFVPVMFVPNAGGTAGVHVFGQGYDPSVSDSHSFIHPLVVMGDRAVGASTIANVQTSTGVATTVTISSYVDRASPAMLGNDLAHEIGHFLGLKHVESHDLDKQLRDTWTRKRLMHPGNPLSNYSDFKKNVGFGDNARGYQLTMRHLDGLSTDNECTTVRTKLTDDRAHVYHG
jgi:hypothetical protein